MCYLPCSATFLRAEDLLRVLARLRLYSGNLKLARAISSGMPRNKSSFFTGGVPKLPQYHSRPKKQSPATRKPHRTTDLARQFLPQHRRIAGEAQTGFEIHQARADQFRDLAIEVLHAFVFAGLDCVQQRAARPLALFDAISSARVGFQNFDYGDAVPAIVARYQPLRNDVAESFRESLSHRLLFGGRERGDDALHRLRGVDGVHAGKNEVAVFGGIEKNLERFPVADFADHNHPRRLTQSRPQRQREIRRIAVQLALVHRRFLMLVQKLNRIFDRKDVIAMFAVDAVNQSGERRRLARAGSARHQDDPVPDIRSFFQLRRQTKRTESRNDGRDYAHHNRATSALDKNIDAESRHSRQSIRNVAGTLLAKRIDGLLIVADQIGGNAACVIRRKYAAPGDFDRRELSVNLDLRRTPRRKNQIADLLRGAQHSGEQNRRRDRTRSTDAVKRNRNRGIPRSSHSIHSQFSALTPQGRNVAEEPM